MVLIVFFSSRISPFTSTVILRERSPRATAVVTSAMLRTWAVRLRAMALTESVRSFQVPATPALRADLPSNARDFGSERAELLNHGVEGFFELQNFAADVDGNFL